MPIRPVPMKGLLMLDFVLRIIACVLWGIALLLFIVVAVMVPSSMETALLESGIDPAEAMAVMNVAMTFVLGIIIVAILIALGLQILMAVLLRKRKKVYRILMLISTILSGLSFLSSLTSRQTAAEFWAAMDMPFYGMDGFFETLNFSWLWSLIGLGLSIAYTVYLFKSSYCNAYFAKADLYGQPGMGGYAGPPPYAPPYGAPPTPYGQPSYGNPPPPAFPAAAPTAAAPTSWPPPPTPPSVAPPASPTGAAPGQNPVPPSDYR